MPAGVNIVLDRVEVGESRVRRRWGFLRWAWMDEWAGQGVVKQAAGRSSRTDRLIPLGIHPKVLKAEHGAVDSEGTPELRRESLWIVECAAIEPQAVAGEQLGPAARGQTTADCSDLLNQTHRECHLS